MSDEQEVIKITAEELAEITPEAPSSVVAPVFSPADPKAKHYGNINAEPELSAVSERPGSILLQGWFYLGVAGLLGAAIGWGVCEPSFMDGPQGHAWGNTWMIPALVTMMCLGFAIAESVVERSIQKALVRCALAVPLGVILGFFFEVFANVIFSIGLEIAFQLGVRSEHNPIFWIARGLAWTEIGVVGGLTYGVIGRSMKKAKYGILGGMLGAGLGGIIFDPIALALSGAAPSRAVGFGLLGLATGVAMGLVESALKDRWLYVFGGPLAGKQFILYKNVTTIGSRQQCDIYLFKDSSILPEHAFLESRGSRIQLRAVGPVHLSGQPVHLRVLQNGDLIQIGRYSFRYQEKHRT